MALTVSLINMKGGVGKSTLAVNLAWKFAANKGWAKNVLLVDLDPQFNASQYMLGVAKYAQQIATPKRPTVWDVFEQRTKTPSKSKATVISPEKTIVNVVNYETGNKLDLLPSQLELALSLKQPYEKEHMLEKFLAKVKDDYDLIVIDCAPTESLLTTAAYLASDFVLVPVKPEFLSTIGLPLLARSLEEFHEHYENNHIDVAGIVFNHATNYEPEESKSKIEVKTAAAKLGWNVFSSEVTYSRSYPKGAREGRPIFHTSNAHAVQKTRFHSFAKEFADKVGL